MITVVNKRTAGPVLGSNTIRIDVARPTSLGNPFIIGKDGSREDVIERYKRWLDTTDAALKAIMSIKDLAREHDVELECWCAPQPCHADVIKAVVEDWLSGWEPLKA